MPTPETLSNNEISSTEKLLDVIRSKSSSHISTPYSAPKNRFSPLISYIPTKRTSTVGVDIGSAGIKLSKTSYYKNEWKLLDYRIVPIADDMSTGDSGFEELLQASLIEFCDRSKRLNIWCSISDPRVEIRTIRIPAVPQSQIGTAVYWTAKKEFSYDENENILDFHVKGNELQNGVKKTVVLVYTAPVQEVERIKTLFVKIGMPLTGISLSSIATQNLFVTEIMPYPEQNVACLHVDSEISRIDIFSEGNIVFTRGIRTGSNSMIDCLIEEFKNQHNPSQTSINDQSKTSGQSDNEDETVIYMEGADTDELQAPETTENKSILTTDDAKNIFYSLQNINESSIEHNGINISQADLFNMILPAVDRLFMQTERTFEHYATTLGNQGVKKLYITGNICGHKPFAEYMGNQLRLEAIVVDPFQSLTFLSDTLTAPETILDRVRLATAIGLSVSDKARTLNFIFTYKEKEKCEASNRITQTVLIAAVSVLCFCVGIFMWQNHAIQQKDAKIAALKAESNQYPGFLNNDFIVKMANKVKNRLLTQKKIYKKYIGMAVISEISALTSSNIRLINIEVHLGGLDTATKPKSKTAPKPASKQNSKPKVEQRLILEGVIPAKRAQFESFLAGYLIKLESSPIFNKGIVQKNSIELYDKYGEVLHFIIEIGINQWS